jgi:hypothetical protein
MTIDATGVAVVRTRQPSVNLMNVGLELVDAARHDARVDEDDLGRERLLEVTPHTLRVAFVPRGQHVFEGFGMLRHEDLRIPARCTY